MKVGNEMSKSLSDIKVGGIVILTPYNGLDRIREVVRITKTQIVIQYNNNQTSKFNKSSGMEVGSSIWMGDCIRLPDSEGELIRIKSRVELHKKLNAIKSHDYDNMPIEKINAIYTIIKGE